MQSMALDDRKTFREIQTKAAAEKDVATLVQSVEGTVQNTARQYGRGLTLEDQQDLASAGKIGALVAAQRYNVEQGANFNTYAMYWIRAYVLDEVFRFWAKGRCPNMTVSARKVFFGHGRVKKALEAKGVEPTPEAIAEALGVTVVQLDQVTSTIFSSDLTYDAPLQEGGTTLEEIIGDASTENVLDSLCERVSIDDLRQAVASLDERDRYVIEQRFFRGKTLEEVGLELKLTKQRVFQIETDALDKLRKKLSEVAK